jgi:hypothetical protein
MNFNKEKIVNKWSPVIENMGYKGNKIEQIACYAEQHSIMENLEANIGKIGKNFLPVAMKIISKLKNLDNVNFNLVENSNNHTVSIDLDREKIVSKLLSGTDVVIKCESDLIDKAVEKIDNAIASLISDNSEVIFETSVLVKDISINSKAVPNDAPTMDMTISYNIRAKQNEPKNEKYFIFLTKENLKDDNYDYCLHDKSGDIFFAKKGEELHTLSKYENIKYKLDELCKTLTEHEPYNYEIIEKLRF